MSERKYSVAEIDQMRSELVNRFGCRGVPGYGPNDMIPAGAFEAAAEAKLRAYMVAGVDPKSLPND